MSNEQLGTAGYTKDELASLTPDELSALEMDNGDEDVLAEISDSTDDAVVETKDDEGIDDTVAATDVESKPDDAVEEAVADAAIDPLYKVDTPADFSEARAQLTQKKADALQKLMDGDMTAADYSKLDTDVQRQLSDMDRAEMKAQVSHEMTYQQLVREWEKELKIVSVAAKSEGLDYAKPELAGEFDTLIRAFSNEATAKGMPDDNLQASKWALAQAHSVMKIRHGVIVQTPAQKTAQANAPKQQRHELTTIGGMPNADRANVDNDTVSRFATLEGEDIEKAMAKMSKSEVERLMESV